MNANMFNQSLGSFIQDNVLLIVLFAVWSLVWKGWALWQSARRGDKVWFGALLILNTVGILEILYIFYFSKSHGVEVGSEHE